MANSYLTRTTGSPTLGTKVTVSAWVKISEVPGGSGTDRWLFGEYGNGSNHSYLYLRNSSAIGWYETSSGAILSKITTRLFRDLNSWYHIQVIMDGTDSTAEDRWKLYVNGERITSWSTNSPSSYSSGYSPRVNLTGKNIYIGGVPSYQTHFNGLMSHTHFCDGTALAPTVFGSTDSTTGEWKINASPTFTAGNNGFTILKDGNTITDQSTNSNHFSLGAGTLTKTLDCPSNVMATLNPLSGSTSNNTLSNGNNTIAVTSGWRWRPSTLAVSSGKYYAEFKPTSGSTIYTAIGVTPQVSWDSIDGETIGSGTSSENKSVGYTHSGTVIKGNSTQYSGSSYTGSGDIIGVALDLDNHKVYFSKNGAYQNSGNPESGATGTGAISLDSTLSDWSISVSGAGTTLSCNYGNGFFGTTAITTNSGNGYAGAEGASKFNYQPPTGYSALNTKGLNE
jgi:hypothetical protein